MSTLSKLIRYDHDKAFSRLLTRYQLEMSMPSSHQLLLSICSHRAEACLRALLDREHSIVNVPLEGGLYRLHIAAQTLWPYATDTFLRRGAIAHVPCDDPAKFPLSVALNAIRDNTCASEWNPNISIFKLLYIFCLPELKEPLETVKLLASKTEQLETITSRFLLQGEVVQFAALLFVAWDKLVQPFSDQGIENCPIGQLILNELRYYQENRISQSSDSLIEIHKVNLENAWKLLWTLDIARDTIEQCRLSGLTENSSLDKDIQPHLVPHHVAVHLWLRHKIYLQPEDRFTDDVKCLRPRLTPKEKAWLSRSIDKGIRSVSTFPTLTERCTTGGSWSSRSYHTLSPSLKALNLVKPCKTQLSLACHKPGIGFSDLLRSPGLLIPRLISALKKM